MESANFHHHQQDDHQILVDSSSYGLSWHQNSILNGTRNSSNSRDVMKQQHMNHNYNDFATMAAAQDMGSPWSTSTTSCTIVSTESFMAHELQHLARIKHEFSVSGSYPGLSEIISTTPTTSSIEDYILKNNLQRIIRCNNNDGNNQDMLFKSFSNECQIKGNLMMNQIPSSEESISYRRNFSQILPTLSISNSNQSSTTPLLPISTNAFDINLPAALDPFCSPTFDGGLSYHPYSINVHNLGGLFKDNSLSYGLDQMHNKMSPAFVVETTEAKRPVSDYTDAKAPKATPTKKSKLELRPCTPLKVRKEKLGDRISALQQMVAPFGKTDTASVLMEAIGYIKFLQSQVETLSVPYMNSTTKASRISTPGGSIKDGNEEMNRDLRSRGLCLVPLSCLSYVTYGGGSIWAAP